MICRANQIASYESSLSLYQHVAESVVDRELKAKARRRQRFRRWLTLTVCLFWFYFVRSLLVYTTFFPKHLDLTISQSEGVYIFCFEINSKTKILLIWCFKSVCVCMCVCAIKFFDWGENMPWKSWGGAELCHKIENFQEPCHSNCHQTILMKYYCFISSQPNCHLIILTYYCFTRYQPNCHQITLTLLLCQLLTKLPSYHIHILLQTSEHQTVIPIAPHTQQTTVVTSENGEVVTAF